MLLDLALHTQLKVLCNQDIRVSLLRIIYFFRKSELRGKMRQSNCLTLSSIDFLCLPNLPEHTSFHHLCHCLLAQKMVIHQWQRMTAAYTRPQRKSPVLKKVAFLPLIWKQGKSGSISDSLKFQLIHSCTAKHYGRRCEMGIMRPTTVSDSSIHFLALSPLNRASSLCPFTHKILAHTVSQSHGSESYSASSKLQETSRVSHSLTNPFSL